MPDDDIYAQLARVSLDDPRSFADSVLAVLCHQFGIAAASLNIYTEGAGFLRLRSQIGFAYSNYAGFDLPLASHAGRAVLSGEPEESSDLLSSPFFINKALLSGTHIRHCYTVPMRLQDEAAHEAASRFGASSPLGAMSFYSEEPLTGTTKALLHDGYVPFVSRLYLATLERSLMDLRTVTVTRVAYRRDISSLAHTFLALVTAYLNFEFGSLWVLDARRNLLYQLKIYPAARSGSESPPASVSLDGGQERAGHAKSLILESFAQRRILVHDHHNPIIDPETTNLAATRSVDNWLAVPIKLPASARLQGRRPLAGGVLELANHYTEFTNVRHTSTPTWEERHMVEFACELLSVLIYQVLRTQDHASDFERMTHGARQALRAVNDHLELLDRLRVPETLPSYGRHVVANALDWVQDMYIQLNLDEIIREAALETEAVALWSDVLAKLPVTLARMNTRSKPGRELALEMGTLPQTFRHVPQVKGNARGLDCVFRNLLDNSRKYCRPGGGRPLATLRVTSDDVCVYVRFSDNGPGIPAAERNQVFEDGYRGDVARGTQTQGLGRGLYDCRRVMDAMHGSIELEDGEDDAASVFVVAIPIFRG